MRMAGLGYAAALLTCQTNWSVVPPLYPAARPSGKEAKR